MYTNISSVKFPLKSAILVAIVVVVVWFVWRSARPQPAEFPLEIPAGVKLLHSFHHVGGGNDHTYAFVFEVEGKVFLQELIERWKLQDKSAGQFAGSFASGVAEYWELDWWPTRAELEAMPTRFEFTDQDNQSYKMVYLGTTPGLMYVEYGTW